MGFEARGDTIQNLLSAKRQYQIPRFQREFSWEEANYKEFYIDILKQIKKEDDLFKTGQYYFGNMLFLGEKEDPTVDVIDGQQRLTTSTIFLAALRDILNNQENPTAGDYANTIQTEYIVKKIDGKMKRKLKPETSYPYFAQKIQDISKNNQLMQDPKSEEEEGIKKTYEFFIKSFGYSELKKSVKEYISIDLQESEYIEFLKSLRDQLIGSEVIAVFINEKNQANQIFENINSKGKPLSSVDLIKNSIFAKVPVSNNSGVDDLAEKWKTIANKVSETKEIAGFNEFFLHYWKATYPNDLANGANLYVKYTNRFAKANNEEIIELVIDLEKKLDTYIKLAEVSADDFKKQSDKEEFEYLTALKYFNAVQVRVPLLALYNSNIKLKKDQKNEIVRFLAYFHFIAFGTDLKFRSNLITTPFKKFTQGIVTAQNKNDIMTSFRELKISLLKPLDKGEMKIAFENLKYAKKKAKQSYSEFPTTFIMKEIAKKMDNLNFSNAQYSIEHIIDEELDPKTVYIGNILVLETDINEKLSKEKHKKKEDINEIDKAEFYKESKYKIVEEFIKSYPDFKIEDIKNRTTELFTYFWDNLWMDLIELPIELQGKWISDSTDHLEILINKNEVKYNNNKYVIIKYEKENNIYTMIWDVDKFSKPKNPQPLIIEYKPETKLLYSGSVKYKKSN